MLSTPSAATINCHAESMRIAEPIFAAKNSLPAQQQQAFELVVGKQPLGLLQFIAQATVIGLSAPGRTEQQAACKNLISQLLASSSFDTEKNVTAGLEAYDALLKRGESVPAFQKSIVDVVVRYFEASLVTGNPRLNNTQTLPFMPVQNGNYLDLASGPLAPVYLSEQFKLSGNTCVFIDNCAMVTDIAREYAKRAGVSSKVVVTCADICDTPKLFEPESFDVIHFRQPFSCFEHRDRPLSDLDIPALLKLLKPNGSFVLGYNLVHEVPGILRIGDPNEFAELVNDKCLYAIFEMLHAGLNWRYNFGLWLPTGRMMPNAIAFTNPINGSAPEACFAIHKP